MKMKIGVTGSRGRIGSRLVKLGAIPYDFDVTDPVAVQRGLEDKPDVLIHTASISSIKECEEEYDKAIAVNVKGTASVCEFTGEGRVLFLSSEQVFDGVKGGYSEEDEPNPINNYGLTKFAAEGIVRQLYGGKVVRLGRGISRESGNDIDAYLDQLVRHKQIHVPAFIKRSYSHLDFLAQGVWEFAQNFESMPDLVHLGGTLAISFQVLMFYIAEEFGLDTELVIPRLTEIPDNSRPYNCGFDVSLAESCDLTVAPIFNSVERLVEEYKQYAEL